MIVFNVDEEFQKAKSRIGEDGGYIECVIVTQKSKYHDKEIKYYLTCPITPGAKVHLSRYVDYYNEKSRCSGEGGMVYLLINLLDKDKNFITSIH